MSLIEASLILPCYNEYENLLAQEQKLLQIPDLIKGELILVDNGSIDGTADYIRYLQTLNSSIVVVSISNNIGYGNGITQGIKAARGALVGWTHADGQFDLFDAVAGFNLLRYKKEPAGFLAMGQRTGRTTLDQIFTKGMAYFESALFNTWLDDISAQPKIMTKVFFDGLSSPPKDFSFDLYVYLMAKKRGLKIAKFTTFLSPRAHGSSSWNTGLISRLKLTKRIVAYSLKLRFGLLK